MVPCLSAVQTWLHPLFRDCLRGHLSRLQRLTRSNVLMVIPKLRHLTSLMVTIMLTSMFSSFAWAEPITIVLVGPHIDTTNEFSFRHAQPGLMIDLVPWAINTLRETVSIDVGTGPAFFSNYKFAGRDFGGPVRIVGTVGAGFSVIPGFFIEYRLQHFSDASAYGPYQVGVDMHLLEINFRF